MRCLLRFLFLVLALLWANTGVAQDMSINNFSQMKKNLLKAKTFTTDKAQAILELHTSEKGFTFKADGKTDVSAKEEDGKITLLVPHKTQFLEIKHQDYGTLVWKVPLKYKVLKKKKHYCGDLVTNSPKKEYHVDKQWAVFYVQPENAILYVDTVMHAVRNGKLQVYLPLGNHNCKAEAPFYQTWKGTITLDDSERLDQTVKLEPIYSYLTVKVPLEGCTILLNGDSIGNTQTVSNRLVAGRYRLTVVRKSLCYYNDWIDIKPTEKKVVKIRKSDLNPTSIPSHLTAAQLAQLPPSNHPFVNDNVAATLHIVAPDSTTTILINREVKGEGKWDGKLSKGLYAINTQKDGLESATYYLWVDTETEQTINLSTPQSAYGMLNVQSNVVDADILINGILSGKTPTIIRNLPADHTYEVKLKKAGHKDIVKSIYIRGNEMNNLSIYMK